MLIPQIYYFFAKLNCLEMSIFCYIHIRKGIISCQIICTFLSCIPRINISIRTLSSPFQISNLNFELEIFFKKLNFSKTFIFTLSIFTFYIHREGGSFNFYPHFIISNSNFPTVKLFPVRFLFYFPEQYWLYYFHKSTPFLLLTSFSSHCELYTPYVETGIPNLVLLFMS